MATGSTVKGPPERPAALILLVEDNPGDVLLLEKSLEARDLVHKLIVYEDGEQAIRAIATDTSLLPGLILVDLNLPRREGFEVLIQVRMTPRLVGVPVGVLTSSNAVKDRSRTTHIGAEKYIHKPPTLEEFVEQVGLAVEELLKLAPKRKTTSEQN